MEWIKAMAEAGSAYVDGQPATAGQLRAAFEEQFGLELKDFDKLLYAMDGRKSEETSCHLMKLLGTMKGRRERLRK